MSSWQSCTEPPPLLSQVVHLWTISLPVSMEAQKACKSVLSTEELARASRFKQSRDEISFIITRGSLRRLLGCYLGVQPDELVFTNDNLGKPRLAGAASDSAINFNVSHSHHWSLLGFARDCNIGVDVEWMNDRIEFLELANRFFSAREYQALVGLPADQQLAAFYTSWTGKEAYFKACGTGLTPGLDRVEIEVALDVGATTFRFLEDEKIAQRWTLQHFQLAPGYSGAVAVEARELIFHYYTLVGSS